MRIFFAILFQEQTLEILRKNQELLQKKNIKGKFLPVENLHLTLKFIGEVSVEQLEKAKNLESIFTDFQAFSVSLNKFGVFPKTNKPRVLWQGLNGDNIDRLKSVKSRLEEVLDERGFKRDNRPFRPHITLVRKPDISTIGVERLNEVSPHKTTVYIKSVSLMSSVLKPTGAEYNEIKCFSLG